MQLLSKYPFVTPRLPLMAAVLFGTVVAVSAARLGCRLRGTAATCGQGQDDGRGLYL